MATWNDIKGYIQKQYPNAQQIELLKELNMEGFEFELETGKNRTQKICVQKVPFGIEMIQILSLIGKIERDKVDFALEKAIYLPFGGLIKMHGMHFIRENVIIDNLSPDKLTMLIESIAGFADALEEEFIGGDAN